LTFQAKTYALLRVTMDIIQIYLGAHQSQYKSFLTPAPGIKGVNSLLGKRTRAVAPPSRITGNVQELSSTTCMVVGSNLLGIMHWWQSHIG
jgi:hypothetical protein